MIVMIMSSNREFCSILWSEFPIVNVALNFSNSKLIV